MYLYFVSNLLHLFPSHDRSEAISGEGIDSVLDEPANPRLFDCMAALEYGAAFLEPMFLVGQAYVDPSMYAGRGSAAYMKAKKILHKQREDNEGVVWLGAGD